MIDISRIETFGWEAAIRGMRNSFASWDKSDSDWEDEGYISTDGTCWIKTGERKFRMGFNDLKLASTLAKAGGPEAKFRRMIHVQCDILAPLYWWKEFDTYKVGTVANSTSTMHSIMKKEFTPDDFSHDYLLHQTSKDILEQEIMFLNHWRNVYLTDIGAEDKKFCWWQIIQMLPSSYNQLRTVDMNYEVLSQMFKYRHNHKLNEWQTFCYVMTSKLPYARELIFDLVPDDTK